MKRSRKRKIKIVLIALCAFIVICAVAFLIIVPPSKGKIPKVKDANGNASENGVAEKTFVDICGVKQGMVIKGIDKENPVLLFLSGGPGIPEYWQAYEYPTGLENHFTVCYWSYRGTALSYNKDITKDTMTTAQFVEDTVAVTNYLRERFGKDKIYLMGHSFGTYIGLLTAEAHPELYDAYIAISQDANQKESEHLAYRYMLNSYQNAGNTKMANKMLKYDVLNSDEALHEYLASSVRDKAMHDLGVGTMRDMKSVIQGIFFPTLRMKDFTIAERINIWAGKKFAFDTAVTSDAFSFNAFDRVKELSVPVYFFAGKYDYTCCYSLQKQYFDSVSAPLKAFYTFGNSAHSPIFEEPERAIEILTQDVLNNKATLQD